MLILDGATGGAVKFQARLSPTVEGGTVSADKDSIVIKNANAVTLHLVAETNFINYQDVSRAYVEAAGNRASGTTALPHPGTASTPPTSTSR